MIALKIKKILILSLIILLVVVLVTPLLLFNPSEQHIVFNQHFIEKLNAEHKSESLSERMHAAVSYYSFVVNSFFHSGRSNTIDFENADAMFSYLFSQLPYYAIVYPTELYYYYEFSIPDSNVSGNLRLVELENGMLGMGYFDKDAQDRFMHKMFGADEGLRVKALSDSLYMVSHEGKSVYFKLNTIWKKKPSGLRVLPEEEFVARVFDESGISFYLYFNSKENAFYYILDSEKPLTENLREVRTNIYVGERTRFAYYNDRDFKRKVLFGVYVAGIRSNNFYDGPFDQVPPRLNLREKVYKAYPYLQLLGVDEHGVFLDRIGTRVSISPYADYSSVDELVGITEACERLIYSKSLFWSCLSYEEKKDWHKESPAFYPNGTLKNKS